MFAAQVLIPPQARWLFFEGSHKPCQANRKSFQDSAISTTLLLQSTSKLNLYENTFSAEKCEKKKEKMEPTTAAEVGRATKWTKNTLT